MTAAIFGGIIATIGAIAVAGFLLIVSGFYE